VRTTFVIPGVERFLAWVYAGYLRQRRAEPGASRAAGSRGAGV